MNWLGWGVAWIVVASIVGPILGRAIRKADEALYHPPLSATEYRYDFRSHR